MRESLRLHRTASSNDNSMIMTSPRRRNGLARSKIMLRRNMLFGDLFPTKSAILRSRDNPKILGRYDAEIVADRIA